MKKAAQLFIKQYKLLTTHDRKNHFENTVGKIFIKQYKLLTTHGRKNPFENNVEKGENADNQHFLLFP